MPLPRRPLGRTGLDVPVIAFGAGAMGGLMIREDAATRLDAVRLALSLGIDWFDTAPSYGDGQSESHLGEAFTTLGVRPRVSTKVRIRPEDRADMRGAVLRSLEGSLRRLRRDRVELLQLHNWVRAERDHPSVLLPEEVLGSGGAADALATAREAGLAQHVGCTGIGDTEALHAIVCSGRFETVQVYHNALNPSATGPVPAGFAAQDYRELAKVASAQGLGVLNIRVLAAGIVAGASPAIRGAALARGSEIEADERRAARLRQALAAEGGTAAQAALRFALGRPGISTVLVGFSTVAQIEEAAAAAEQTPLSPATLARLEALWASDFVG